jgi:hypothetical protein
MQIASQTLIKELTSLTEHCTAIVAELHQRPESQLRRRPTPEAWNALECLEHLNRYGDYYLPAIEKAIIARPRLQAPPPFRSGWLGNYFANLMRVKETKVKKMKSPADKNPFGADVNVLAIDRFLKQQERLLVLLGDAANVDLVKARVAISIAPWIRIRLGDTLRFFVYHIERHVLQAKKAAESRDEG